MHWRAIFAILLATLAIPPEPALAGTKEDCAQATNWVLRIDACTAMIGSGQYTGRELAIAHFNRGRAQNNLGETSLAIEDYDMALLIYPELEAAYYNRANAYIELGEYARAIEGYNETLRINPNSALAYNNRGEANSHLGEYPQALDDFNQALRIDPSYVDVYRNRGIVYESMGEFDLAVKDWDQEVQLGGAERAKWWQEYLTDKGHYSGELDGIYSPGMWAAMLECARDPDC